MPLQASDIAQDCKIPGKGEDIELGWKCSGSDKNKKDIQKLKLTFGKRNGKETLIPSLSLSLYYGKTMSLPLQPSPSWFSSPRILWLTIWLNLEPRSPYSIDLLDFLELFLGISDHRKPCK
jgi:hypothetical protein